MSFGFAIGDFVALGKLAWGLYKQCKGASAEFAEICNEVLSIHTALRELEDEAQNEDSILNRAGGGRQKELNNIVQNCTEALRQLESLVTRYRSLGTSQKKVWDRIKFGDEGIQVIRNKLVLHTSTLTLFLTSLGTGSLGRIEKKLDDIVTDIRAGHHEPSVITAVNDDAGSSQNEAWRFLSRELAEDFSREEIEAYKGEIKSYIKELVEKGALEGGVASVRSDQEGTCLSTPTFSSSSTPTFRSRRSFPETAGCAEGRWPPMPTAESGSDSDGPGDEGFPSQIALKNSTGRLYSPVNEPSILEKNSCAPNASTNITHLSNGNLPAPRGNGPRPSLERISRGAERWGDRCNIGIELGADHCRVAAYDFILGKAVSLTDEFGCIDMPTCVAFTADEILVGTAAKVQVATNTENTFSGFTCLLGKGGSSWRDREIQYKQSECSSLRKRGSELVIFVPCRQRHYTLVELTAMLMRHCLLLAMTKCQVSPAPLSTSISSSPLVVKAMAEAAEIAGIHSPNFVSNDVALAHFWVTQQHRWVPEHHSWGNWLYHGILIVQASTRGYDLSIIDFTACLQDPVTIHARDSFSAVFGASVDHLYAKTLHHHLKNSVTHPMK
jgi:Hsp70 protein